MLDDIRQILGDSLQIGDRRDSLNAESVLLGNLPELDSLAVVNLITALEDHYGFYIDDDEVSAETFATLGTLTSFVERKVNGA